MSHESMSEDFILADGRRARVHWVNGPPYLSVFYRPPPEQKWQEEWTKPIPPGKMLFRFVITYFKPNGKFYTEVEYTYPCKDCGPPGHPSAYMNDVAAHIRGMNQGGGQEALPGLINATWDGYILITCDQGFPVLIVSPREKE